MINAKTFSQVDSIPVAHNLIYVEAAGIAGYGSINYERMIYSKNYFTLSTRVGFSSYHLKDFTNKFNPDILIPLTINGCYGKKHKIDFGAGETVTNIVYADKTDFAPKRITRFHTVFSIGYRYQKNTGGIVFRCAYTPLIEFNRHFRHWAGISLGYSF